MHDTPWVDNLTGPMEYVPTRTASLTPSPETVANMVKRMIASDWPTTEEERRAWFTSFGLKDEQDVPRWGGDAEPGAVPTGWHAFKDEFVGLHWFMWEGWPRDVVEKAADELRERLTEVCGVPSSESQRQPIGWTAYWDFEGKVIDMYFYTGFPPAHLTRREMTPSVQFHVDHAERAEAEEQQAVVESTQD